MDLITALLTIEQQITIWLFATTPDTKEDFVAMSKLFALRDMLEQNTNAIILKRLQLAGLDVSRQADALNSTSAQIETTAKRISTINTIIDLASGAVAAA